MKDVIAKIKTDILQWRKEGYKSKFTEIKEILNFQKTEIENQYKYLRKAQFEAIETYLFLRFVKQTPKIIDLYKDFYNTPQEFCKVLNINHIKEESFEFIDTIDNVLQSLNKEENKNKYKYHSLIETLNLDYPSYILALAMGSGKTNIISSIIAIEFAIAIENEKKAEFNFMQNALVFAPGLTILKNSLKKISVLPFETILPPEMCKKFLANVKYIQADNKKELNVISNSKWNVVVMNSEKIILKADNKETLFNKNKEEKNLASNHRLEKIKSLPNLGIFSDEAHHTYGNKIGNDLKKVRETINHIHKNKELVCVVNTTGTPYADKKMLKDVIFWYGLEDGIKDGILKSLHHGVKQYNFENKNEEKDVVFDIIKDFFSKYKTNEKIAFYFKSEEHLERLKPYIEQALLREGFSNDIVLKYTLETKITNTENEFLSLDEPENKKRVILLIGMGKEGWDCKTLFATALITESSSSNNYILQASTRCLRQIEGNTQPATIYLSSKNAKILNEELQANYGITTSQLNLQLQDKFDTCDIYVKKPNPPKLEIKVMESKIVEDKTKPFNLTLVKPDIDNESIVKHTSNLSDNQIQPTLLIEKIQNTQTISILLASNIIAAKYHLKNLDVLKQLQAIYQEDQIPEMDLKDLFKQIDTQKQNYIEKTEEITKCLAIIKTDEGFKKSEDGKYYYHTIRYKQNPDKSLFYYNNKTDYAQPNGSGDNKYKLSFHYEPYNFDSTAEYKFFDWVIKSLDQEPDILQNIEDIYFTGGLTTPDKTDIHFEYKDVDGRYRRYYPDFIIRKKDGQVYIVEIKGQNNDNVQAKEKAMDEIAKINSDKIKYCIIYSNINESFTEMDDTYTKRISKENWEDIINFIKEKNN